MNPSLNPSTSDLAEHKIELEDYLLKNVPSKVFYIPNFINGKEEKWILNKVANAPKPKWTQLRNRRLQNWGGIPRPKGMIVEPLPDWLEYFVNKINDLNIFQNGELRANHVLINEYLPGQGIMPHVDGPLFYPTIATISCGSHTVLEFEKELQTENTKARGKAGILHQFNLNDKISLLLERASLVIIQNTMYTDYKHSIQEITEDMIDENIRNVGMTKSKMGVNLIRDTRISLTIRHVPKISKIQLNHLLK